MAVYSRSDGIVDWRACLDPAARQVEVDSTHCGMSVHGEVFDVVSRALRPRLALRAQAAPAQRPRRRLGGSPDHVAVGLPAGGYP